MELGFPDGAGPPEPEREPDWIDLLAAWGRGDRRWETWLAFAGFLWIVFLIATLVFQVLRFS